MKLKISFLVICCAVAQHVFPQSVAINNNGNAAHPSAILDVSSTAKGVLVPRMTMAQRDAIVSPANSLLIYQNDSDSGFYYYSGSIWIKLASNLQNPSCLSIVPAPAFPIRNVSFTSLSSNTVAYVGQVVIPFSIEVDTLIIASDNTAIVPGKVKIGLYSENGQEKLFEVTTDTISTTGPIVTRLLTPVSISPGLYYFAAINIQNSNVQLVSYLGGSLSSYLVNPGIGAVLQGTLSVSANTLPANFDPSTITYSEGHCIYFRLN